MEAEVSKSDLEFRLQVIDRIEHCLKSFDQRKVSVEHNVADLFLEDEKTQV